MNCLGHKQWIYFLPNLELFSSEFRTLGAMQVEWEARPSLLKQQESRFSDERERHTVTSAININEECVSLVTTDLIHGCRVPVAAPICNGRRQDINFDRSGTCHGGCLLLHSRFDLRLASVEKETSSHSWLSRPAKLILWTATRCLSDSLCLC